MSAKKEEDAKAELAPSKATGELIKIFVTLDNGRAAWVEVKSDIDVSTFFDAIDAKFKLGGPADLLVVRSPNAAAEPLTNFEAALADVLVFDAGKHRVYVEVPKKEEAKADTGHLTVANLQQLERNLQAGFSKTLRAYMTFLGAAKGVSTQAEFYQTMTMTPFVPPPAKRLKTEHEEKKYWFKSPRSPHAAKTKVQKWMNKWIEKVTKLNSALRSVPIDGHKIVTFSNKTGCSLLRSWCAPVREQHRHDWGHEKAPIGWERRFYG